MAVRTLQVGSSTIGDGHPVFVIAEIGINHEGNFDVCAKMIEEAVKAGADSIKLQTIDADSNYAKDTKSYHLFKTAELTIEETSNLFDICKKLGVSVFTTVGDFRTLDWVSKLDPCAYKISSGLLNCLPVVEKAAQLQKPLLMSTGMALQSDIDAAMDVATKHISQVGLFQCTSLYPAPFDALDLASIRWLSERYQVPAGFSDHSAGIEAAGLAVIAGATMIEKHFTLDATRDDYDHRLSLEPREFANMVESIRRAEKALGAPEKRLLPELDRVRRLMGRYLSVARDMSAGECLCEENFVFFRYADPGEALPASFFNSVVGKKIRRNIKAGEPLIVGDIDFD